MMLFLWLPASSRHVRPFRSLNTNKTPYNTFQVAQLFRVSHRWSIICNICIGPYFGAEVDEPFSIPESTLLFSEGFQLDLSSVERGCHYINFGQVCSCVQWDWKERMKVEHDYILDVVWSAFFMSLKSQWNPFLIDFMIQLLKIENKNSKNMLFHLFLFMGEWSQSLLEASHLFLNLKRNHHL